MNKVFLSFADSRMRPSARRIEQQAVRLGVYDRIIIANEMSLDEQFRDRFRLKLVFGSRGFGYWCWKPQIILQTLNEMNEGDILQYTDVGCHLNVNGMRRLLEYFTLTERSKIGILAFQAKPPTLPLHYDNRTLLNLPDICWAKGDLLDYLGVRNNKDLLLSQTIGAGIILIRKTETASRIIHAWREVLDRDFSLIDDSLSRSPNLPEFIEHRHDQAIFSILCKLNNVETLSAYEYWYPQRNNSANPDWNALAEFPIHARRDKKLRLRSRLAKMVKGRFRCLQVYLANMTGRN